MLRVGGLGVELAKDLETVAAAGSGCCALPVRARAHLPMRRLGNFSTNPRPQENSEPAEMYKNRQNCGSRQSVCGKQPALLLVGPLADKNQRNLCPTGYIASCGKPASWAI